MSDQKLFLESNLLRNILYYKKFYTLYKYNKTPKPMFIISIIENKVFWFLFLHLYIKIYVVKMTNIHNLDLDLF